MKEVKINDNLSLRLERRMDEEKKDIIIYVKGKPFIHCKCLLINPLSSDRMSTAPIANSIDVISENMPYQEINSYWISEETEFWAYRSNLEVWCENDYSTELLHREIAFPLLKELSDAGDSVAKKVFSQEIIDRLEIGTKNVVEYLINRKYLDYLSKEQLEKLFTFNHFKEALSQNFRRTWSSGFLILKEYAEKNVQTALDLLKAKILEKSSNPDFLLFFMEEDYLKYLTEEEYRRIEISEELTQELNITAQLHIDYKDKETFFKESRETFASSFSGNGYTIENGRVIGLDLHEHGLIYDKYKNKSTFPKEILDLSHLEFLNLSRNHLESIPEEISKLKKLKILLLESNKLQSIPESIDCLEDLEELNLEANKLSRLPESIGNLKNLQILELSENFLIELPQTIGKLQSLRILNINSFFSQKNVLKELPETLFNLINLEILGLKWNLLTIISPQIGNLRNLRELNLSKNKLNSIPDTIGNLPLLVKLDISGNQISKLPDSIRNLKLLTEFNAKDNPIEEIPESIVKMNSALVVPVLTWLTEKGSKQAQQMVNEISLPLTDLNTISRLLSDLSKKIKDNDLNLKEKANQIEQSLMKDNQFLEKIGTLKEYDSQSKIISIFYNLIKLGSDEAKRILKDQLIKIVRSEDTPSILYLVPYFRILDEVDLKEVSKNINAIHLHRITEMIFEESKRENYKQEERLEGTFFIQQLRSAGFSFILNLIKGLKGDAQKQFIIFLFSSNMDMDNCYFCFSNNNNDQQKFILALDKELMVKCLKIFIDVVLTVLKRYNYNIDELLYETEITRALRIIISEKKDIWDDFYEKEILSLSDQEILAILSYLFIEGCFADLTSQETLNYFKKFDFEDIGEAVTRFFNENERDTIRIREKEYFKLGEFGGNLLFYLIKHVRMWEFREDLVYYLKSMKEKFPRLVTELILKYGEYDKMEPELFIYNLVPGLDEENKSLALNNLDLSKCVNLIRDDKSWDIDYLYTFLGYLIEDIKKQKIKVEDPLNSKFVESFIEEFIFDKFEVWDTFEEIYKTFAHLIKEDQIINVFEKYEIIQTLATQYESNSLGQIRIRWFFIHFFTELNSQVILKIYTRLPDNIGQGIISELKSEIEEYEYYYKNKEDEKYTALINELRRIFDIVSKNIKELRTLLIDDGVWNTERFKEMEQEFEDNPEKYNYILELLFEDINFYDVYRDNYYFSLQYVVKHSGGKAFLKVFLEQLLPKGWPLEKDLEFLEEYFQPYSDGGEPIYVVGRLTDILREGLKSTDHEYRRLCEKFLSYLLKLLKFILREERLYDPYQDDYVKSILGLLVWLYKFYNAKLIDQAVEDLPDRYQDFFYDQKKQLDDFRKVYPGIKF